MLRGAAPPPLSHPSPHDASHVQLVIVMGLQPGPSAELTEGGRALRHAAAQQFVAGASLFPGPARDALVERLAARSPTCARTGSYGFSQMGVLAAQTAGVAVSRERKRARGDGFGGMGGALVSALSGVFRGFCGQRGDSNRAGAAAVEEAAAQAQARAQARLAS